MPAAYDPSMSAPTYRFGGFRVDPATRRLWKGEDSVALRPKVFDCIVYLIEHRDRAVGRDELISAVWGKIDISDGVLGQTILQARRSLDDTGKEQTTVRTVQGFGYHWVAKVDIVAAEPSAVTVPRRSSPSTNPKRPTTGLRPPSRRRMHTLHRLMGLRHRQRLRAGAGACSLRPSRR